jgi:hypothetical protein
LANHRERPNSERLDGWESRIRTKYQFPKALDIPNFSYSPAACEKHYGCSNAYNRGTCTNRLTMRREVIEAVVLSGLKTHLMQPDLVKEFIA